MKKLIYGLLCLCIISCSPQEENSSENTTKSLDLEEISIEELQYGYSNGMFSIEEVTAYYIERIEKIDASGPGLNSVIMINPDAMEIAKNLDYEWSNGAIRGPLHGIPVLLKDNIDTHDKMPCTAGSRAMANSFPLEDSWVAAKLREAGAIILGKANLSEWANFRGELSSSGWSGINGQTKNPYVLDRNPCGSSSGSGAAVSANLCVFAIGTETNGSIVCPATANGIVGIKPTVGLISRSGIIPISFTQDTPGPMARNLSDAVIALGTMTGIDPSDAKTAASEGKAEADYTPHLKRGSLSGKRIGWYTEYTGTNYKVDALMEKAVADLEALGAEVIEIESIYDPSVHSHSFELMLYEYKDGLNKYFASLGEDAVIKNLDELIAFNEKDSIEMDFYRQEYLEMANAKGDLSEEAYQLAVALAKQGMQDQGIDAVMDENQLDAIIAPTGSPAWKTDHVNGDHYLIGSSSPAAIAGYPNITIPMGFVEDLPVGISFFGRAWTEGLLIEMAYDYEQETQHRKAPEFREH